MWIFQCCERLANFQARVRCNPVSLAAQVCRRYPRRQRPCSGWGRGVRRSRVRGRRLRSASTFARIQGSPTMRRRRRRRRRRRAAPGGRSPKEDADRDGRTDERGRRERELRKYWFRKEDRISDTIQQPFLQDEYRTALLQQVLSYSWLLKIPSMSRRHP